MCVFVSLAVKDVHLEAVSDLMMEAFVAALRRFIAHRGHLSLIWSDVLCTVRVTNETPKCLAIVANCRRKQGGRNQGSSQLTVWQWLTRIECKLTS